MTAEIILETKGDENAQVSTATYVITHEETQYVRYEAIGVSKRDPGDKPDIQLGIDLAEGRALRELSKKILADANKRVRVNAKAQEKQKAAQEARISRKTDVDKIKSIAAELIRKFPDRENPSTDLGCVYEKELPDGSIDHCFAGEVAFLLGWRVSPTDYTQFATLAAEEFNWPIDRDAARLLREIQRQADTIVGAGRKKWGDIDLDRAVLDSTLFGG